MIQTELTQQLAFIAEHRHQNETAIIGEAVREGLQSLYRETLIEAYLLGQATRETVLKEIGLEQLEEIEYQRDALKRDVTWGVNG